MQRLQHYWYQTSALTLLLTPLSWLFAILAAARRFLYQAKLLSAIQIPVPVVVVGNISVGGTGKTPLTLWLAQEFIAAGWHPGIISRGYLQSGASSNLPKEVSSQDLATEVGDEPLLMAQRKLCPVWISRDRPAAALALLQAHPECDIILSDDGLQHYRLRRAAEIAVVDGARRFGNGQLLPACPLREPISRLKSVTAVVVNGGSAQPNEFSMRLIGTQFYNLLNPEFTVTAEYFAGQTLHAIAGIGHPQRFFQHLQKLGLNCQIHAFPDHHQYRAGELDFTAADALLMTEKDAVKCTAFATEKFWVLRVDAEVDTALAQLIIKKVSTKNGC